VANTFILKRSNTASNVPAAGELSEGELAINTNPADRKLFSKDSGGTVFEIGAGTIGGSITDNQIAVGAATADSIEGSANLTFDGTTLDTNDRNIDMGEGRLDVKTIYATGTTGGIVRIYGSGGTAYFSMLHNDTDINLAGLGGTVDMNITGLTAINAGTVDADFDNVTATDFNAVALTAAGSATSFLNAAGTYTTPTGTYSHPSHPGDDFTVDTGPLTGATVVSDIDINVTTDTLGHVTDANGVVSTRTITLDDIDTNSVKKNATETITGAWRFDGQVNIDTNSNASPLRVSRTGVTNEEVRFGVGDAAYDMYYQNDEAAATMRFTIENTDTESGGGAAANTHVVEFSGNSTTSLFDIRDGVALRIRDSLDTSYVTIDHDANDLNITGTGAVDIDITGYTNLQLGAMNIVTTGLVDGKDVSTLTSNTGTVTGTGANDQIAVWTGTSALEGTGALTFGGTQAEISSAAPFWKFEETGVTGTPVWWWGADGGAFSLRLNNTGAHALTINTNAGNDTITGVVFPYNTDFSAGIDVTGNATATGDMTADNFEATGLGPNTTPGTDDAYFGGYGVLGSRGAVYVSNVVGPVALNYAGLHGVNTKLQTSTTGVTVTGTMAATTVTGANVTSGANPGHTHTGILANAQDITGGIRIDGGGTSTNLDIYTSSVGSLVARFGWDTGGPYWRSLSHGAVIAIEAEDAGGTVRTILTADPDSTTELRADTNLELSVTAGADTALLATANAGVGLYHNNGLEFGTQQHEAAGVTSGAYLYDNQGSIRDVGFNDLKVIAFSSNQTLNDEHCGSALVKTGSTALILYLPSVTTQFQDDAVSTVINGGSNAITINASTNSRTLYWLSGTGSLVGGASTNRTLTTGGVATILRSSSTVYYIWGSGIS